MDLDEISRRIESLPKGYISKKTIRGKECLYRQWKEDGKVKSEYIRECDADYIVGLIEERRQLQSLLRLERYKADDSVRGRRRLYEYYRRLCMGRKVAVGVQDFETLMGEGLFYVDKTGFIKEWWNRQDPVTLITRPRRFGKTLTLSMVECFLSLRYKDRGDLFEGLEIWQDDTMRQLQGTLPVISVSFGGIKSSDPSRQMESLKMIVREAFTQSGILIHGQMNEHDRDVYESYMGNMTNGMAVLGLHVLSELLYNATKKKVVILLDEYDTPLLEAWSGNRLAECTKYMRELFNVTFKSNPYLSRAILTGITRISKESFFSDMNNLKVCSMLDDEYATAFGFTETEVLDTMDEQGLNCKDRVKEWYDGFNVGSHTDIYNPWSIVNYLRDQRIKPFWVNSSSNAVISRYMMKGDIERKVSFETLLSGGCIKAPIDEELTFDNIENSDSALWSLLYASGYLKVDIDAMNGTEDNDSFARSAAKHRSDCVREDDGLIVGGMFGGETANNLPDGTEYTLRVTNKEVLWMLGDMVKRWFSENSSVMNRFVEAMLERDVDYMNEYLNRITEEVFSYFDVSGGKEPERFYHGFILGLIMELKGRFIITSNRESGLGRYDVVMQPVDKDRDYYYVIEFKVFRRGRDESLEDCVNKALRQIEEKRYDTVLVDAGIASSRIMHLGIGFDGKRVLVSSE